MTRLHYFIILVILIALKAYDGVRRSDLRLLERRELEITREKDMREEVERQKIEYQYNSEGK